MRSTSPRVTACPERQQALDFYIPLIRVEIQVQPASTPRFPVSGLEGEVWSLSSWVAQHHPTVFRRGSWHVMQSVLPKRHRSIELRAVDDDRPDSQDGLVQGADFVQITMTPQPEFEPVNSAGSSEGPRYTSRPMMS